MNLNNLLSPIAGAYVPPTGLTLPNLANVVHDYLESQFPAVLAVATPGVWITGSRVWRHAYLMPIKGESDLDILCETDAAARSIVAALNLQYVMETSPRMSADLPEAHTPGKKYLYGGLTVDVWAPGPVSEALSKYPHHTHAHAKIAYCPATQELRMFCNQLAPARNQRESF